MKLLDITDISKACGVSRPTLYGLMGEHGRPEATYSNGSLTLYQQVDVMKWLEPIDGGKYARRFDEAHEGR